MLTNSSNSPKKVGRPSLKSATSARTTQGTSLRKSPRSSSKRQKTANSLLASELLSNAIANSGHRITVSNYNSFSENDLVRIESRVSNINEVRKDSSAVSHFAEVNSARDPSVYELKGFRRLVALLSKSPTEFVPTFSESNVEFATLAEEDESMSKSGETSSSVGSRYVKTRSIGVRSYFRDSTGFDVTVTIREDYYTVKQDSGEVSHSSSTNIYNFTNLTKLADMERMNKFICKVVSANRWRQLPSRVMNDPELSVANSSYFYGDNQEELGRLVRDNNPDLFPNK